MEIIITGRNLDLDDALKRYIHKRLDNLERLYGRIYRCDVVLEEEKLRKNVEIILHLKKARIVAKESSPGIYASIDNASENIKKQLRRLNDRLVSKRRKAVLGKIIAPVTRLKKGKAVSGQKGRIVKIDSFAAKPMLPSEAKLELEVMEKNFIVFKNADTGEVNVMYKRHDGNYGLIEPSF